MPTYTYEILKGKHKGKTVEFEQSIKDLPFSTVTFEGKEFEVKRIISGSTNFILRGGCWHRDGYSQGVQSMPTKEERATLGKPKK